MYNTILFNDNGSSGIAAASARSLIYGALRLIGVLRPGQATSPEAMDDGLLALEEMVDSWNTERLIIYAIARDVYANLDSIPRPVRIERAAIIRNGETTEQQIEVLTPDNSASGRAGLYSDNAYSSSAISTNPAAESGDQVVLYTWQRLEAFGDFDTTYSFPPGYVLALRFNLAIQLAPQFVMSMKTDKVMFASLEAKAVEYKAKIKSLNARAYYLRCDDALVGRGSYDIRTNGWS